MESEARSHPILSRYRLAIGVLPGVAIVLLAKWASHELGFSVLEAGPLIAPVVTANVFLLGFLLAGTMTDYKESERLPGEIAAHLESIADECWILWNDKAVPATQKCLQQLDRLGNDIAGWLKVGGDFNAIMRQLRDLDLIFLAFEPHTQANFISRLKSEQGAIRSKLIRINGIRETNFIGAAYAVAEIGSALLFLLLISSDFAPIWESLAFCGIVAFFLGYMQLLIRDMDNPFDATAKPKTFIGRAFSGEDDEVSPAPILHAAQRIKALHAETLAVPGPA